ncbi:MAG TPA: PhzF family phenazine biosynthesis protein [Bauldia sp.]|nr:PhzF family phenazine biosynthesis protein [Bauldia sp.]
MAYRYVILDVFTDRPLAGNPLAVLPSADGLDDAQMQAIAREFNLSETVFVFPPTNPVQSAKLRIFTPGQELPFAGHPTVGTAVYLASQKLKHAGPGRHEAVIVLEENVGSVRCGVMVTGGPSGHAIFDVPRRPEAVTATLDRDAIAAVLGLRPSEIGFENHKPSAFSAGTPYVYVPVRDLDAMARARPKADGFSAAIGGLSHAVYLYCRQVVTSGHQFHARCFAPEAGIIEDPATGGAAAAFPGVIHRFDELKSGNYRYVIEQGIEMGRPSVIQLEVDVSGAEVAAARVGGDAVIVAEGTLDL